MSIISPLPVIEGARADAAPAADSGSVRSAHHTLGPDV
jgi:hypothetical protein